MNFEVHRPDGEVDVFEDFVTYGRPHVGLWMRAETRHEFLLETWGDIRVSCHVRRDFRGLRDFENEARFVLREYHIEAADWVDLLKIRRDSELNCVEEFEGAHDWWLRLTSSPHSARRGAQ